MSRGFRGRANGSATRSMGIFGGDPGGTGRFLIRRADGREEELPTKPALVDGPDEALVHVETAGAGTAIPRRAPEAIAEDIASGKFSAGYIAAHYPNFTKGDRT